MNLRRLILLASSVAIVSGIGASSFAWFTGKATSTGNEFKVGKLGIEATAFDDWSAAGTGSLSNSLNLNNMQPGDEKTYKFTVTNKLSDGKFSTLGIKYKNNIIDLNSSTSEKSLLDVAKFDVIITGQNGNQTNLTTYSNLGFSALKDYLVVERVLPANKDKEVSDFYEIKVRLPGADTDNSYQGKTGSFKIETIATQNVDGAVYSSN